MASAQVGHWGGACACERARAALLPPPSPVDAPDTMEALSRAPSAAARASAGAGGGVEAAELAAAAAAQACACPAAPSAAPSRAPTPTGELAALSTPRLSGAQAQQRGSACGEGAEP